MPALPETADLKLPDWAEAEPERFPAVEGGAGPAGWSFGPGVSFTYDFSQVLNQRAEYLWEGQSRVLDSRERNRGAFGFTALPDRRASVQVRIETEEQVINGEPVRRNDPTDKEIASVAEALVSEDGAGEIRRQKGRADLRLFFDAILRVAPGDKVFADGYVRTKAAGRVKVERFEALRLETEFEFRSQKPSESALLRGRAVGHLAEGRLVRCSAAVATSTRKVERNAQGIWVTSKIDATTTLLLRLLD
jgi:hypothetical protein